MPDIPITVGIIGHSDAVITDEHEKIVTDIFNDIDRNYPNSPVTLFSQLAKGVDLEVAKLFITIKNKTKRRYNLVVPLPFEEVEYQKDFNADELLDYQQLIDVSERHFTLGNTNETSKDELYRKGGQFVADSSIILIAIWDGNTNNKKGGTSDLVEYKKDGSFKDEDEAHIFDLNGSLISIPCNRQGSDQQLNINLGENHFHELIQDKSIEKSLSIIEHLNIKQDQLDHELVNQSSAYLFPKEKTVSNANEAVKDYYSIVDTIAIKEQKEYSTFLISFFVLGLIILFSFECYKEFGLSESVFAMTIGLIGFSYLIFRIAHNRGSHEQYIENRLLAEALRVQFFWNLSGIKKSVSKYILRIHKTEYNWIKHILLSIYGLTYNTDNTPKDSIEATQNEWIINQHMYFRKMIDKLIKKKRSFDIYSNLFLVLAVIALIGVFVLHHYDDHHVLLHPLIVLDSLLFGSFALMKAYYEKKGYEQIRNQYTLMANIFSTTDGKINEIQSSTLSIEEQESRVKELLYLAGIEALVENGNWYVIFKDKELEVEIGG